MWDTSCHKAFNVQDVPSVKNHLTLCITVVRIYSALFERQRQRKVGREAGRVSEPVGLHLLVDSRKHTVAWFGRGLSQAGTHSRSQDLGEWEPSHARRPLLPPGVSSAGSRY